MNQSPKAKEIKAKKKKYKCNLIKLKSFCPTKENINKMKRQAMEWEKIFVNDAPDEGSIS